MNAVMTIPFSVVSIGNSVVGLPLASHSGTTTKLMRRTHTKIFKRNNNLRNLKYEVTADPNLPEVKE